MVGRVAYLEVKGAMNENGRQQHEGHGKHRVALSLYSQSSVSECLFKLLCLRQ